MGHERANGPRVVFGIPTGQSQDLMVVGMPLGTMQHIEDVLTKDREVGRWGGQRCLWGRLSRPPNEGFKTHQRHLFPDFVRWHRFKNTTHSIMRMEVALKVTFERRPEHRVLDTKNTDAPPHAWCSTS